MLSQPNSIKLFEEVGFIDTGLVDCENSLKILMKN